MPLLKELVDVTTIALVVIVVLTVAVGRWMPVRIA